MSDCEVCNGTGKKPETPYRTAANKVKEVMRPVGNVFVRSYAKVKHGAYAMTFGKMWNWIKEHLLFPAVAISLLAGLAYVMISSDQQDRKNNQTITLQFDDNGWAVRCWVGHGGLPFIKTNHNHFIEEKVKKSKPVSETLHLFGAPEDMKCIDY